ncbi:nucleotidyltransferase domain-containing protein [Paenibacillus thermotolerans]|uniref:nucleotidyltransferase domain-containing protein n=1 Tax=Paenibacillus thermotolerans TaxID=3027807 RepID=UPI002368C532|nr:MULTISPECIES: nucleotidyltransferase domain-containing protein [unclassified Paenibacillus]
MVDVFAVADIIVGHIRKHYPDDVAVVGYYGSYLQGRATERSDLDFFFIPATPRGREVELQFIIDGISFDFWPIGWERAERMAAYEDWSTTVIADCELLYVRSDDDLDRFMNLREKIRDMGEASHALTLTNRAEEALRDCMIGLAQCRLAGDSPDLSYCRTQGREIATGIFKALALVNQTYYTRMWGHFREQVRKLPIKPENLERDLDVIMFSRSPDEIMSSCESLIAETMRLIANRKKEFIGQRSYKDRMKGYYEEERGMLNKLLTACERGHYETAFFGAVGVQEGLAGMLFASEKGRWPGISEAGECRELYHRFGYPDLAALLDPADFEPLRLAVLQLIEKLESRLREEEVPVNRFGSVADFEAFYKKRVTM